MLLGKRCNLRGYCFLYRCNLYRMCFLQGSDKLKTKEAQGAARGGLMQDTPWIKVLTRENWAIYFWKIINKAKTCPIAVLKAKFWSRHDCRKARMRRVISRVEASVFSLGKEGFPSTMVEASGSGFSCCYQGRNDRLRDFLSPKNILTWIKTRKLSRYLMPALGGPWTWPQR